MLQSTEDDQEKEAKTEEQVEEEIEENGIILMLFLICSYVVVGSWMEHKHLKLGHETGAIIIIGMLISLAIYYFAKK